MFRKSSIKKDRKIRKLLFSREKSARIHRFLQISNTGKRFLSYKCRFRNRCVMSGRARSINKVARTSRIFFRTAALQGVCLGTTKSSW